MNPVVLSVCIMLLLALLRVNVVAALTFSAIVGGLMSGIGMEETIKAFEGGLGGGATTALSYAMLGTFAVALSRSGLTQQLSQAVIKRIDTQQHSGLSSGLKYFILTLLALIAISSQNVIPVHIAFIPILLPPLLEVFNKLRLDRRMLACVLTFGLVTPYMVLPIGFGGIFLNEILLANLASNGLTDITANQVPKAMLLPALGMVVGLLMAVFVSYRKPRDYQVAEPIQTHEHQPQVNQKSIVVAMVAIITTLIVQLTTGSMILGGLAGFTVFTATGVIAWRETQGIFTKGVHMMAMIGFIMIAASGFANVMKETGGVDTLIAAITTIVGDNKPMAALLMLIVGLLVTMGIGSSFSTIPIIATIYVPLAATLGFSPMATIALVGTAAALGDAGSPASDSTLGPTSGLSADGQHDHIRGTVIPTFLHYNLPLILFGWIAAITL